MLYCINVLLSGNYYVNTTLNAAVGFAGAIIIAAADWMGRRVMLSFSFAGCGAFCLASLLCASYAEGSQCKYATQKYSCYSENE